MRRNNRRGHLLFGLAGLIVVMTAMTLLLLTRSLEMATDAARLERRLAWRAAAEGAALMLEQGATLQRVSVGDKSFSVQLSGNDGAQRVMRLVPEAAEGDPHPEQQFEAHFHGEDGNWRLSSVLAKGTNQ